MTKEYAAMIAQDRANDLKAPTVYYRSKNGQWLYARKSWWDKQLGHKEIEIKTVQIVNPELIIEIE